MSRYPFFGDPAVYVDPTIVSFTASPAIAEMGATVAAVVLRWQIAKDPLTLKVAGQMLPNNTPQLAVTGPFTTNQSWAMSCADAQKSTSAKTTLAFVNANYLGFAPTAPATSADILALDMTDYAGAKTGSVTIGDPSGKLFVFAYPARYGALRKVLLDAPTGLWQPPTEEIAFTDYTVTTVSFTNRSGFTENYCVVTFNAPLPYASTVVRFS